MRRWMAAGVAALALFAAACGGGEKTESSGGKVTVTFWHGQSEIAKRAMDKLVAEFNRTHPNIRVDPNSGGVLADQMLPKVTASLAAGKYPDIAYIFGSDLANVARSPKVADLTDAVQEPRFDWDDFWPAARAASTVKGRVRAIPALLDDLALAYNPEIFAKAGVAPPTADWSWDDYRAAAKKLTDPGRGQFGAAWPIGGGEDTVWRIWPMVWQRGGDILTPDLKKTAFNAPPGQAAMGLLGQMAADKSVYLDSDPSAAKMNQAFINGKIAMLIAGPWTLPDVIAAKAPYKVVPLPGTDGKHTTISGPDTYVVLDNGDARKKAATEFLHWLTAPEQDLKWDKAVQNLPLRQSTAALPEFKEYAATIEGLDTFIAGLADARTRPVVEPYPQVSHALGEAMIGVMLGKAQPGPALADAAKRGDAALAGSPF